MYGYPNQQMMQPMMGGYPGMMQQGMMGQGMMPQGMMQPGMVQPGMVPNMMNQRMYNQPMGQQAMGGQPMMQMQMQMQMAQVQAAINNKIDSLLSRLPYYINKQRVKNDASIALNCYKTLSPALLNPPTRPSPCFTLSGNLPICYKGNTYHIPIAIYLTEKYPESAPICYVCPTAGMDVNPATHTDPTGRIRVPYLAQWNMNTSNIIELINAMVPIFNNEPPVRKYTHHHSTSTSAQQFGAMQQQQQQQQQQQYMMQQQSMSPQPNMIQQPISLGQQQQQQQFTPVDNATSVVEAKLQEQFLLMVSKIEADVSELSKNEEALLESKEENTNKEKTLKEENEELDAKIAEMQEKIKQLSAETQTNSDEFDLEKATKPPTVLETQLTEEVAKTHAYDDELYVIDNAFKQKKISLEKYIDTIKEIAREQYFSRALSNKIREVKKRN